MINAVDILEAPQIVHEGTATIENPLWKVSEARKTAMESFLKKKGWFSDENGVNVCDINSIKACRDWKEFDGSTDNMGIDRKGGEGHILNTLAATFKDKVVYSSQDYAQFDTNPVDPKPLFYIPKDSAAILDINAIKSTPAYMGLWEIHAPMTQTYPTQDATDPGVDAQEAIVGALIYHPKFGNGMREPDGNLWVTWGSKERKPIKGAFFESWNYTGKPASRAEARLLVDAPDKFFDTHCSNLIPKFVDPSIDFPTMSGSSSNAIYESLRRPTDKGLVTIDGWRYNIGSSFKGSDGYRVSKISNNLAVVTTVSGEGRIGKVEGKFRLELPPKGDVAGDQKEGYIPAGRVDWLSEPEPGEQLALATFEEFHEFANWVSREAHINIAQFSPLQQSYIADLYQYYGDDNPRLLNFLQENGGQKLKVLMALKGSTVNCDLMLDAYAEAPLLATTMFPAVERIVDTVTNLPESITDTQAAKQVSNTIFDQTGLLLMAGIQARNGTSPFSPQEISHAMESFQTTVELKYNPRQHTEGYQRLLDLYAQAPNDESRAAALALLQGEWRTQIAAESLFTTNTVNVANEVNTFYLHNPDLFATAEQTTGDTPAEQKRLRNFIQEQHITEGLVVDAGCGPGERMTSPMAFTLEREGTARVVGVDMVNQFMKTVDNPNLSFLQGSLTHLPFANDSVRLITLNWSVFNDLYDPETQQKAMQEMNRVLANGGMIYCDVAHLEGEGGWGNRQEYLDYQARNPRARLGVFEGNISGRKKHFDINPEPEMGALFESYGFDVTKGEWMTDALRPRITYVATKNRPSLI